MLPVIPNLTNFTLPPPIVNTAVPGTAVTHVPYDNVAPSVSSAQIDNNARGNNGAAAQPAAPAPSHELPLATPLPSVLTGAPPGLNPGAQATFIAQLAGQDTSPETQVVLVEYEKMVTNSNVKYKPSDAQKPKAELSSVFDRILQAERQPPTQPIQQAAAQQKAAEIIAITAPVAEARPVARNAKSQASQSADTDAANAPEPGPAQNAPRPSAITAYLASAARIASFERADGTPEEIA